MFWVFNFTTYHLWLHPLLALLEQSEHVFFSFSSSPASKKQTNKQKTKNKQKKKQYSYKACKVIPLKGWWLKVSHFWEKHHAKRSYVSSHCLIISLTSKIEYPPPGIVQTFNDSHDTVSKLELANCVCNLSWFYSTHMAYILHVCSICKWSVLVCIPIVLSWYRTNRFTSKSLETGVVFTGSLTPSKRVKMRSTARESSNIYSPPPTWFSFFFIFKFSIT